MIKRVIALLIIITGIFIPVISYAVERYHILDDINFIEYPLDSFQSEDINSNVKFKFMSNDGNLSLRYLKSELSNSSRLLFIYLNNEDIQYFDCKPQLMIQLYTVPVSSLNDGRFTAWQKQSIGESLITHTVFGIYEPNTGIRNLSAILIATKQSAKDTKILIAHEISHYWYDRLCLNILSKYRTEEFARKFEGFFREKNAY